MEKELLKLCGEYENCQKCPALVENRSRVVFGVGNPDTCKVVIIGEAPGAKEDELGVPFVGRSGKILDEFLASIDLKRPDDVYITNTVLCRPPKNRDPKRDELANCRDRLDEHLRILNPKVVITLGNFSTRYLLDTKEGITDLRGKVFELNGFKVVPMKHPAVVLYNGNSPAIRAEFEEDFNKVKSLL